MMFMIRLLLYLAVFALQTNVSSNCLIFRSYEFLTIRKPINPQYNIIRLDIVDYWIKKLSESIEYHGA
jgi:hypothetical protein